MDGYLPDLNTDMATEHGFQVFYLLSFTAPKASFYLYQVTDDRNKIPLFSFLEAVDDIKDDNIDVLNISAGQFKPGCNGDCHHCEVAKRLSDQGITVVASAGNQESNESIECPAWREETIAVGGILNECTADYSGGWLGPLYNTAAPSVCPPGAYTAQTIDANLCGGEGCEPGKVCDDNLQKTIWENNVVPAGSKPETCAPVDVPTLSDENGNSLVAGTSFSAAVVSGGITNVLSTVSPPGVIPYQVKEAVRATSVPLADQSYKAFNALRMHDYLV